MRLRRPATIVLMDPHSRGKPVLLDRCGRNPKRQQVQKVLRDDKHHSRRNKAKLMDHRDNRGTRRRRP